MLLVIYFQNDSTILIEQIFHLQVLSFIPNNSTISTNFAVSKYSTITAIVSATAQVQLVPWWVF